MSKRFYVNGSLQSGTLEIRGVEAHHLTHVSRVRPGDLVSLFNGDGNEYEARVIAVGRRTATVEILNFTAPARELEIQLEIAAPLPKGDRGMFLIEKLTELGVTRYVPIRSNRSIVHPGEGRREKLERHVVEASKQCGRNVLLMVEAVVPWTNYISRQLPSTAKFVAHPGGRLAEKQIPAVSVRAGLTAQKEVAIAIGPEGGFTDQEIEEASQAGWRQLILGPRILRIETAAIVAAAWAGDQIQVSP